MGFWNWLTGKSTSDSDISSTAVAPREQLTKTNATTFALTGSGVCVLDPPGFPESDKTSSESAWWAPEGISQTEPLPPSCSDLKPETRAIENLLISHFDGHDLTMPALLPVAEKALSQLRTNHCSLADIGKTVADDPVITAAVFRMANSALYRGVDKITSLPTAVSRLGTSAMRTLMMHESMRAAMSGRRGGDAELANLLWRRSIASGTIMRGLSRFTHVDEEDAFLSGLLHDIGNVIVLRIVEGEERTMRELIDVETFDYLCHECHQEFGELVAQAWKLPLTLCSLVSDHHSFPSSDDPQRTIRLQLLLTDMMTSTLGYAHDVQYDLMNTRAVKELGLSGKREFVQFLDRLPDELSEAVGTL